MNTAHNAHNFLDEHSRLHARRSAWVAGITTVTMVGELVAGYLTHSMALTADGWHMASHAAALAITVFGYGYAEHQANNPSFSFGTGKVSSLAGFTSALALLPIALYMLIESCERFIYPKNILFNEALWVAAAGLAVNLVCALILKHDHHHSDHNIQGAYLHVVTDAFTSILAIAALTAGKFANAGWLDPAMGVLGAVLILRWSQILIKDCAQVLLDYESDQTLRERICASLTALHDCRVTDLHIWQIAPHTYTCIIALEDASHSITPQQVKNLLQSQFKDIQHISVEINPPFTTP